ncbi:MAG: hypothetical protein KJ749_11930 [Planctomycetes bacterium]|nr:hypothetical protein [Planctomycetota bacterium]
MRAFVTVLFVFVGSGVAPAAGESGVATNDSTASSPSAKDIAGRFLVAFDEVKELDMAFGLTNESIILPKDPPRASLAITGTNHMTVNGGDARVYAGGALILHYAYSLENGNKEQWRVTESTKTTSEQTYEVSTYDELGGVKSPIPIDGCVLGTVLVGWLPWRTDGVLHPSFFTTEMVIGRLGEGGEEYVEFVPEIRQLGNRVWVYSVNQGSRDDDNGTELLWENWLEFDFSSPLVMVYFADRQQVVKVNPGEKVNHTVNDPGKLEADQAATQAVYRRRWYWPSSEPAPAAFTKYVAQLPEQHPEP